MTIEDLLPRLEAVRRSSRGYQARCVAHDDHSPSLSIRVGERGLLVKCWAGCSLQEICMALGIEKRNLFFDTRIDPETKRQRDAQRRERERQREQGGLRLDTFREAEATIAAARDIDISRWSHAQLDDALNRLADAHATLDLEAHSERIRFLDASR